MIDKPQLLSNVYLSHDYTTKQRWISYWHQIKEVTNLATSNDKILHIGHGNGVVTNYLRKVGFDVTTLDIDPALHPDHIGDITELVDIFAPNSFDIILCAEVLEHIPFDDFEKCIMGMQSICRKNVVVSLPNNILLFYLTIRLPFVHEMTIKLSFQTTWIKHKFDNIHYWEIGKKGFPVKRILKIFRKHFTTEKNYYLLEHPFHMFFVLRKKNEKN